MLSISDVSQITNQINKPTAIALGNFDGLHQGHRQVIAPVLDCQDLVSTVVSFEPHPQEFFTKAPRLLLTPLAEKAKHLEQIGIEQLVLLPFTQNLSQLSPNEFIEQILINQLQAQKVSVGANFRFGYQRRGTVADLAEVWGDRLQVISEQVMLDGVRISSSRIREELSIGDVEQARALLGRNYVLSGIVVTGQKIGRTIGFPTANLQIHPQKFLPRDGVYAVRVKGESIPIAAEANHINGVMNIGMRPTVKADGLTTTRTVEVHILDWQRDLYGQEIEVEIIKFLRPEQKFASIQELKAQIRRDCEQAIA